MRTRLFGFFAASLLAAAAHATPIVTINGGTSEITATPGSVVSITLGVTPDAEGAAGYNLIFAISDPASVSVGSCVGIVSGVQISCSDPTGLNFSFGGQVPDLTSSFNVASFQLTIAANAAVGATVILTGGSTVTTILLDEPVVGPLSVVRVVAAPEPATAAMLGLGLGGLMFAGRKRRT
jgi:hypothetical protein